MSEEPTEDREQLSDEAKAGYEPPSVEEVNVEDSPAVTAAGARDDFEISPK